MSIDMTIEKVLPLEEARLLIPGQPSKSTLWRWWRIGVDGIRLETIVIGGKRFTSSSAIQRFSEALTRANEPASTVSIHAPMERDESMHRRLTTAGLLRP